MVACIGPLATVNCEPRQAWKGAAAAVDPCAGVWWVRAASILLVAPALSDLPDYGVKNPHLRFVNCGFLPCTRTNQKALAQLPFIIMFLFYSS